MVQIKGVASKNLVREARIISNCNLVDFCQTCPLRIRKMEVYPS
jgi:hypothetical protein